MINYQSQFLKLVLANLKAQELQDGTIKVIIKSFKVNRKLLEALGIKIIPYRPKFRPKGEKMPKDNQEPGWFKSFRKEFNNFRAENNKRWEENNKRWDQNDKRWEENNKRWDQNDKRWEENNKRWEVQAKFNQKVAKNFDLLFSLPTIQQEIKTKTNQKTT